MSGALTGSILNSWKRASVFIIPFADDQMSPCAGGVRGVAPGFAIGAIGSTLLQLMSNELRVQRLKFVSRRLRAPSIPTSQMSADPPEPKVPWTTRFLGYLGIRKLSDEEYLARLMADRDKHLARIAELEKERVAEATATATR